MDYSVAVKDIFGEKVSLKLAKMKGTFLLSISAIDTEEKHLFKSNPITELSMAIGDVTTTIIASEHSTLSSSLARSLSLKLNSGRPVYVSYTLDTPVGFDENEWPPEVAKTARQFVQCHEK